jgi:catechol 2,3-dioxygenase-like lactoylglutathione lyase family enzyme
VSIRFGARTDLLANAHGSCYCFLMTAAHFILYVQDQDRSTRFYQSVLNAKPRLNVPGMTEFELSRSAVLGLMPEAGIKRLLGNKIADPAQANGTPRAELYLLVDDPAACLERALVAGAPLLSPLAPRSWGHEAGYVSDPDGHIVAFAKAVN